MMHVKNDTPVPLKTNVHDTSSGSTRGQLLSQGLLVCWS